MLHAHDQLALTRALASHFVHNAKRRARLAPARDAQAAAKAAALAAIIDADGNRHCPKCGDRKPATEAFDADKKLCNECLGSHG